jgi:hypothetical protein
MSSYLNIVLDILKIDFPDSTFLKTFDFDEKEYVSEFSLNEIFVRCGFDWSNEDLHFAFEVIVLNKSSSDTFPLLRRKWNVDTHGKDTIYFKYIRVKDLMSLENRLQEEFEITNFIDVACRQINSALNKKRKGV